MLQCVLTAPLLTHISKFRNPCSSRVPWHQVPSSFKHPYLLKKLTRSLFLFQTSSSFPSAQNASCFLIRSPQLRHPHHSLRLGFPLLVLSIVASIPSLHDHITLYDRCKMELQLWHGFLSSYNDFICQPGDIDLYTNAPSVATTAESGSPLSGL